MSYGLSMPTLIATPSATLWTSQSGCGEDVVVLPGLCETATTWTATARRLAHDFRVTIVEPRGIGRSTAPVRTWRMRDFVEDLKAVLDRRGIERAHVVGSCLGAVVSQEFAAAHPERVRSLTLNGTWRGSDPHFQALLSSWIWTAQHARTTREVLEVVALSASPPASWERGEVAAELDGPRRHGTDFGAFQRGFISAAKTLRAYDAAERLRAVEAPTLITVGAQDAVRPRVHALEVAAEILGARVEVIPGAGRRPFVDEPGLYGRLVHRFLGAAPETTELAVAA
jgi:3-oxoadipate enol-lactonase